MQAIPVNELVDELVEEPVSATFEACVMFSTGGDGAPVCASCGWLETEHAPLVPVVRSLPRPARARLMRTPKRLAS